MPFRRPAAQPSSARLALGDDLVAYLCRYDRRRGVRDEEAGAPVDAGAGQPIIHWGHLDGNCLPRSQPRVLPLQPLGGDLVHRWGHGRSEGRRDVGGLGERDLVLLHVEIACRVLADELPVVQPPCLLTIGAPSCSRPRVSAVDVSAHVGPAVGMPIGPSPMHQAIHEISRVGVASGVCM